MDLHPYDTGRHNTTRHDNMKRIKLKKNIQTKKDKEKENIILIPHMRLGFCDMWPPYYTLKNQNVFHTIDANIYACLVGQDFLLQFRKLNNKNI